MSSKVVNINTKRKGFREESKVAKIEALEARVQILEGALQNVMSEMWQLNANGVTIFKALEGKDVITEEDIKASWDENIVKPYEKEKKAKEASQEESRIITP